MSDSLNSGACMHPRIAVFAREPRLGHVKSRLASEIGEAAALAVYQAMLSRVTSLLEREPVAEWDLWVTSNTSHESFLSICNKKNIHLQDGGDLGARMEFAVQSTLAREDSNAVLVIGTDCPVLSAEYLCQALTVLDSGVDVVLGPAEDGGYVLVGMRQPFSSLFSDIVWGSDQVLAQTLNAIEASQLSHRLLDTLWDVDRPEDLERLTHLEPPLTWDGE